MAESPAHKFGQLIGNLLEELIEPSLADFATSSHLYLDYQKKPRSTRKGKKVTWEDLYGNTHDLDYVFERDGTSEKIGTPVAFIEVAWRRYTKHSRNKAQEIQGAILPLAEKYRWSNPFLGAVLAGVFTEGSLDQLRSHGFQILYFPYDNLIEAFATVGIDIRFDERTSDEVFRQCVKTIENMPPATMQRVKEHLVAANQQELLSFMGSLEQRLARMVEKVVIIPLYGQSDEFSTIEDALRFLNQYRIREELPDFRKYEILVTFTNGDRAEGSFKEKTKVQDFLQFIARQ